MTVQVDHRPAAGLRLATPGRGDQPSLPARMLIVFVRLYQRGRAGRPSPCRFDPSCSAYAVEALGLHGAARGTWLT
ncbi:MAG: membrane protein insertion efficiency factor YidD, partial [Acidimicrobiales bacterium]